MGAGFLYRSAVSLGGARLFSESDTSMGIQVLGGTELVFRDAPRFVVSIDLGYHSTGMLFDEISVGGLAFGLGAHWYFK